MIFKNKSTTVITLWECFVDKEIYAGWQEQDRLISTMNTSCQVRSFSLREIRANDKINRVISTN
jgi:hypothetical protein